MTIVATDLDTPAGPVRIAVRDDGAGATVVACGYVDHWDTLGLRTRQRFPDDDWTVGATAAADAVRAYLDGALDALDALAVDTGGTAFQRRVWTALRTIPVGRTWSYKQLAEAVGAGGGMRAVGQANGANPVSIVVPCHRVIRSDGSIGGYGGGIDRKEWLLAHEGARLV